eukprot:scaffold1954_cov268-Pinguiococcus_pyrenoidosus.AAC.162
MGDIFFTPISLKYFRLSGATFAPKLAASALPRDGRAGRASMMRLERDGKVCTGYDVFNHSISSASFELSAPLPFPRSSSSFALIAEMLRPSSSSRASLCASLGFLPLPPVPPFLVFDDPSPEFPASPAPPSRSFSDSVGLFASPDGASGAHADPMLIPAAGTPVEALESGPALGREAERLCRRLASPRRDPGAQRRPEASQMETPTAARR